VKKERDRAKASDAEISTYFIADTSLEAEQKAAKQLEGKPFPDSID